MIYIFAGYIVVSMAVIALCLWFMYQASKDAAEERGELQMQLIALTKPEAATVAVTHKLPPLKPVSYVDEAREIELARSES